MENHEAREPDFFFSMSLDSEPVESTISFVCLKSDVLQGSGAVEIAEKIIWGSSLDKTEAQTRLWAV